MTKKEMKLAGHSSFAAAAAEAYQHGYWPVHRRDGMQVYANDEGDAVAFARDGRGTYTITRDFPTDGNLSIEETEMMTNTAETSAAEIGGTTTTKAAEPAVTAKPNGRASAKKRAPGKGTGQAPKKSAAKAASGAPRAKKAAPKKAARKAEAKAAVKAAPGAGPRPGSGMDLVVRLAKAGKTDEQIIAAAAKELPKVKTVNDARGVAWCRWQAKKNGWLK